VNYVDKPDTEMKGLVANIRKTLNGNKGGGPLFPFLSALYVGRAFDVVFKLTGRATPLGAIRVKKFCADIHFTSLAHEISGFEARVGIQDALDIALRKEFISPD
jgi:hypothetical protein